MYYTLIFPVEKCNQDGVRNPIDFCAVFTNTIKVYGHNQKDATYQVLELINKVLNKDDPGKMHTDLVRMKSLENMEKITPLKDEIRQHPKGHNGIENEDDGHSYLTGNGPLGISKIAWAGFIVAVLIISLGLLWLVMDRRKRAKLMFDENTTIGYSNNSLRRPRRRRNRGNGGSSGLFGSNFFLRFNGRNKNKNNAFSAAAIHRDPYYDNPLDEQSIRHSPEANEDDNDIVDLDGGNSLLLNEDGRPVEIDYNEYQSNSSASSSSDGGGGGDDNYELGAHSSMLPVERSEGII